MTGIVRREADHRTAVALAVAGTIGVVAVTLQVAAVVPLGLLLATQVVLTGAVMGWHACTCRGLGRRTVRRG